MALRNQEIAQRIKALREGKGNPPQPIVAAALPVSLRTYQNWEAGDAKPEYRNLEALARFYGVSEEFILTGTENAQPESPVVVSTQMDEGFEEFRVHVQEIRRDIAENRKLLEDARSERERIEKLLIEQEGILNEIKRVAAGIPSNETLDRLSAAARQATEIVRAGDEEQRASRRAEGGAGGRSA